MPRVDQSTINWAVYEDNTEYAGMAQATLPNLTALTQSISGAGIAGNVDAVILGHFDAMSMTLNYRTMTEQAVRLSEPRRHNIDLRYAVQDEDPVAAAVQIRAMKSKTATGRAAGILSAGASGIWYPLRKRASTMKNTASGGMRICQSCPSRGSSSCRTKRNSSLKFCVPCSTARMWTV